MELHCRYARKKNEITKRYRGTIKYHPPNCIVDAYRYSRDDDTHRALEVKVIDEVIKDFSIAPTRRESPPTH